MERFSLENGKIRYGSTLLDFQHGSLYNSLNAEHYVSKLREIASRADRTADFRELEAIAERLDGMVAGLISGSYKSDPAIQVISAEKNKLIEPIRTKIKAEIEKYLRGDKIKSAAKEHENGIELKPRPSDVLELSKEDQTKIKERFEKAKSQPKGKPEHDPYADYGHGYVGIGKKKNSPPTVQIALSEWLKVLGYSAMAKDVLKETDHSILKKYADIIVRDLERSKHDKADFVKERFKKLNLL